jgi:hypothetical protein
VWTAITEQGVGEWRVVGAAVMTQMDRGTVGGAADEGAKAVEASPLPTGTTAGGGGGGGVRAGGLADRGQLRTGRQLPGADTVSDLGADLEVPGHGLRF